MDIDDELGHDLHLVLSSDQEEEMRPSALESGPHFSRRLNSVPCLSIPTPHGDRVDTGVYIKPRVDVYCG